ncbi:MAG: hypothetical protein ABIA74_02985 [bacterium]
MIKNKFVLLFLINLLILFYSLDALNTSNAIGSNTVYALGSEEQYTTAGGGTYDVWGMVDYQYGLHVDPTCTVNLGLACPIRNGSIRLDSGAQIGLLSDLHIGSSVDLQIGAAAGSTVYIKGNGNSIICHGNLTIPANRKIRLLNDITIDMQGNELYLEDAAQLIIIGSNNFMIKNAVVKNLKGGAAYINGGGIATQSNTSKISLDDVILDLSDTYSFDYGSLYIYNDVRVRGENKMFAFATYWKHPNLYPYFQGVMQIAPNSTFMMDVGTIFKYHQPCEYLWLGSLWIMDLSQKKLVMADRSSRLFFNNCRVQIPVDTIQLYLSYPAAGNEWPALGVLKDVGGIVLTKGTVIFNNRVILECLKNDGSIPDTWTFSLFPFPNVPYYPVIQWGDGSDPRNDIDMEILSGCKIETYGRIYGCNTD